MGRATLISVRVTQRIAGISAASLSYTTLIRKKLASALLLMFLLCTPVACLGDVIYSTLGPGDLSIGGALDAGSAAAIYLGFGTAQNAEVLFQSSGSFSVNSITVAVDYYLAGFPLSPIFDAYLYSDTEASTTLIGGSVLVSHAPNAEIAEVAQGLVAPNAPGFVTFNPVAPLPALNAGSFYWLFLTPNNPQTSVVWDN